MEIGLDDGEPVSILRRLVSCVAEQSSPAGKQRRTFVSRYWFLAMLLLMIPAGLWLPEGGRAIKDAGWVTPVLVGMMMGISGFTLDTGKLHRQAANLGAISAIAGARETWRQTVQYAKDRKAFGQRMILTLDAFAGNDSIDDNFIGGRVEILWRF